MPRQARIDAPGAIHHIICRGQERRKVFLDDTDRDGFVSRLGDVLQETSTRCFAWTLIPNHFHILLQAGEVPLATVMRRLLTGYAVVFNRRHNRAGHVFQNRYKSILCQTEPYLLELVRYIHLNPIRAGIVGSMSDLKNYRYCGHRGLVCDEADHWQEIEEVLLRFAKVGKDARREYELFVAEGIAAGKRPDLTGGGLVRSAGGWQEVIYAHRAGIFLKSDERILGDSEFVEAVLAAAEEQVERKSAFHLEGGNLDQVAQRVANLLQLKVTQVLEPSKRPTAVQARSLLCYWATRHLGMTAVAVSARLGLSPSAVSRSALRGEQLALEQGWHIE